jgi:DNA polymerase III gamma/tau subunit
MRDSLSLLDQVINFGGRLLDADTVAGLLGVADRGRIHALLDALVRRDAAAALLALASAHDYGLDLRTLGRNLANEARDLLVVHLAGQSARQLVDRSDSEISELQQVARHGSGADLERIAHVLLELAEQVAKARYPRLVLEMGVVRLCRAPAMVDVAELAARVEVLLAQPPRMAAGGRPGGSAAGGASPGSGGWRGGGPGGGGPAGGGPAGGGGARAVEAGASLRTAARRETSDTGAQPVVLRPDAIAAAADEPLPQEPLTDGDLPRLQAWMAAQPQGAISASLLDSAVVSRCTPQQLTLGMANAFLLGQLAEPAVLELVARATAAVTGVRYEIMATQDPRAATESSAARKTRTQLVQRQDREQRLRNAPEVQAVLQVMRAEIVHLEIETEGPHG